MKNTSSNLQSGAVSLFAVIFSMLLITVVTVSFIRLMVNDEQQASDNDLSQSAYDSAQAGVEDAKRALLRYQALCKADPNTAECVDIASDLNSDVCNGAIVDGFIGEDSGGSGAGPGEIQVQQSQNGSDAVLNQAYTCVTMKLSTGDYIGSLGSGESKLVPLAGTSSFDHVTVRWFSREDLGTGGNNSLNIIDTGPLSSQPLYAKGSWPSNRPPLMRSQLMQFSGANGFTLESFDATSGSDSNANTVFLYPSSGSAAPEISFTARDQRKTSPTGDPSAADRTDTPMPVTCRTALTSGGYSCSATLALPQPIGGTAADRTAFMRLTALYNTTHYQVVLHNGTDATAGLVNFNGVQPEIDSTGRANDLFRRVVSRVELFDTNFPFPEAAVDLTGNFCKDFGVTDSQYIAGTCTP